MKAIIDGKLYDTEKSEHVYTYAHKRTEPSLFLPNGVGWVARNNVEIYKTKRGTYFEVETYKDKIITSIATNQEVKQTISELNPDKFIELFGDVE